MNRQVASAQSRGPALSAEPLHREHFAVWRLGLAAASSRRFFEQSGAGDPFKTADKDSEIDHAWAAYQDLRANHATGKQHDMLSRFVVAGLEVRGDDQAARLTGPEVAVYVQLGEFHPGAGLRVCIGDKWGPGCFHVYRACRIPRVERCRRCHRSPIPWAPQRGDRVGWADPWDPACRQLVYTRRCSSCNQEYRTAKADIERCGDCRGHAASARRRRGGTAYGRQAYRYAREDGEDFQVSFTIDSDGHSLLLTSVDGVVMTPSAEVAKRLKAQGFVAV